ncbi:MAG TPA: xanthine dehydrogenase family protein subunit M [Myxococcaceae bacterium]|jgi:carbon-monoxide dehydrogenase medium subunit|nr:xanthine dehydrogenase family protein subunit M [Myxococcaceae bacterium]
MYPSPFEYHRAGSVQDAVALLGKYGEDAKVIAGGHSLLPLMKLRLAQPKHLVDIRRIPGLNGIREDRGAIVIGAATPHAALEASALLRQRLPIVSEAAGLIGDAQVRNMGTVGGSLAHADPGADLPAVMLALGAELSVLGPKGTRTVAVEDFFVDMMTTALAPSDVITEVRVPFPPSGSGAAYEKFPHPASRYALAGVAALLTVAGGKVTAARVAITGLGTKASRAKAVEAAAVGKAPDAASLGAAAERANDGLKLRSDAQLPEPYRRSLAVTFTRRALTAAAKRAGG